MYLEASAVPKTSGVETEISLSDLNMETIKVLYETRESLEVLINKHCRPRAQSAPKDAEQSPRSLRFDAGNIQSLAYDISKRVQHLHEIVGS
jgi:hypothetical protein